MSLETDIPNLNQQISSDGQQSAVIAYLGQLALSDPAVEDLFAAAITSIVQVLAADITLIWELEADGKHLSLRSTSGGIEAIGVNPQVQLEADSFEALMLRSADPVLVSRLAGETRFKLPNILIEHGGVSGIGMRIGTAEKPFGILEVFSQRVQTYAQNDLHFLQAIANILTAFLDMKRKEARWATVQQDLQKQLVKAKSVIQSGQLEWDRDEIKSRLVESRERERLQLAQELHDIPIQDLYGLMYQLDDLKDILKDTDGEAILEDFNRTLRRVVDSLRSICGELRPPSLSPFGLEVAIRDHVEKVRNQNPDLQIHLDLMRDQQILSDSLRLCLFRIYQQSMNNVIRHAQASDVHIRFRWDEEVILLEVEDNGNGFEMPHHWIELVRQGHLGLVGLVERVESVQGKLEISSAPGDGTLVRVIIPRR